MTAALLELELILDAPDPRTWLDTHLRARFDDWEEEAELDAPGQIVTAADLVADDAALLRTAHAGLVADGTPAPAAATYLTDWYAGALAGAVGYALATAGAGFVLSDSTDAVRFHLHPDGWPYRVELPARAVVLDEHPWATRTGTDMVADQAELLARAVHGVVVAGEPIVEACHGLARVGAAGLWNEVADSLGKAVAFQHLVQPTPAMLAILEAAVAVEGVPWKARPQLGFAPSDTLGPVHVAQKGGCCLAYTAPAEDVPSVDDPALTPYHRAYLTRFPVDPDQPRYCSTCSFRDPADTTARQVFWHEHHAPTTPTTQGTQP